jgi:hypothetical protein
MLFGHARVPYLASKINEAKDMAVRLPFPAFSSRAFFLPQLTPAFSNRFSLRYIGEVSSEIGLT